ncbi:murein biosynthesis integral membrane protein MurJ [Micromonospora pattaloongensis]|uniref:murein biosynthesis integral membrane protein MurJ n=1 Tax=Micromonospora pattaloongensis TaxID=405436 RepID=UPI000B84D4F0|nr:lipid II flippase MurJ [Micromonospora pattaloongensis]
MASRSPGVRRVAGAAALIAVLTVVARLAGFGRNVVFVWGVGATDLGDIYQAANTVPNIIFEIVAGGALASLVVPLLAGAVAVGDRAAVAATTSALLTWTLTLLVPLAAIVALAADPIIAALVPACTSPEQLATRCASPEQLVAGARMLRVFAPQLPLYGIGIVLTGVLQAHHRFAWPVIAPLLSSVTVIGTYLTFAITEGRAADLPRVGAAGQLLLAIGTTLGVVVLSLCLFIPLRRLRLRLRPGYRFPADARRTVGGLALAGAVTVGAQQIAVLVTLKLALAASTGTNVLFTYAQTVYLLPWAVLAVPVATAAYPTLSAARATGDEERYRATLAPATRAVVLLTCLGAAALVALARPAADLLIPAHQAAATAAGIAGFAPGLLGYGLFAVLSRALYARGEPRPAAAATAAGWLTATLAAVLLSAALPAEHRVMALTLANSVGMTVLGALLVRAVARRAGRAALAGLARAGLVGVLAAAAAALAGLAATGWLAAVAGTTPTRGGALLQGMLSGVVVLLVFLGVAYPLDRHDIRPMTSALTRRLRTYGRRNGEGTRSR